MTHPDQPDLDALLVEARKGLLCIYLETRNEIADDVKRRVEAVFAAYDTALKAALARESEGREDTEHDALDLDLLRKFAFGEGGRRTGALKRAGYLEWFVTRDGYKAIDAVSSAARHPETKRDGGS